MGLVVWHINMDLFVLSLLAVIIGCLSVFLFYKRSNETSICRETTIPGAPRSHPTDGNKKEFDEAGSKRDFVHQLHQKYGPIVSFYEETNLAVSIASPEICKQMRFLNVIPEEAFKPFKDMIGDECFIFLPVEQILHRRKLIEPLFASRSCKTFYHVFHEVAQECIEKWSKLSPNDSVNLPESMRKATLKAILRTSFGNYFKDDSEVDAYMKRDEEMMKIAIKYPKRSDEEVARLKSLSKEQKNVARKILEARKNDPDKDEEEPILIDILLSDEDVSDECRVADCFLFLGAGHGTTALTLSEIIHLLCVHQDVQGKVYEEMKHVLGDDGQINNETLPKLTYLRQVTDETLRYIAFLDMIGRTTAEDMELGGHLVPKGANVYQNFAEMAKNPEYFPNPDKFNPENFSKENVRKRNPYTFKPFGFAGKRQCPGISFSYVEVPVLLSEWCRRFEFNLVPGSVKLTTGMFRVLEEASVTLTPRNK